MKAKISQNLNKVSNCCRDKSCYHGNCGSVKGEEGCPKVTALFGADPNWQ